jgi:hypothetical protein
MWVFDVLVFIVVYKSLSKWHRRVSKVNEELREMLTEYEESRRTYPKLRLEK